MKKIMIKFKKYSDTKPEFDRQIIVIGKAKPDSKLEWDEPSLGTSYFIGEFDGMFEPHEFHCLHDYMALYDGEVDIEWWAYLDDFEDML